MSEKVLGEALLSGEGPIDVGALTDRVLRRDRRRTAWVAAACVLAWMLVVMLPWATVMPLIARVAEYQASATREAGAAVTAQQREQSMLMLQAVRWGTIATFVGSVASMFVAAVSTVCLVIVSRRATLRQVNARLAQISADLRARAGTP